MSQQKSYAAALRGDGGGAAAAVSPVRREGRDGRDGLGPSCTEGDDSMMNMMLAKPIVCVFFSYTGILSLLSGTMISLLVRLTLHFSVLEGTNGE